MDIQKKTTWHDRHSLIELAIVLSLLMIGFWKSWSWYLSRVLNSLEESIGLVLLLVVLIGQAFHRVVVTREPFRFSIWPVTLALVFYSLMIIFKWPDLIRAALAFLTVTLLFFQVGQGYRAPISFWGLVLICLPIVPSLQFYLGYPARIVTAWFAVPLLQMQGVEVVQEGTFLKWQAQLIQLDAPCSGVTMLWAGEFIALTCAFVLRFNRWWTLFAILIAAIWILIGNVLRATSLFYWETQIVAKDLAADYWSEIHSAIGVAAFLIVAIGTVTSLLYCSSRQS